jgi:hypothetical protein
MIITVNGKQYNAYHISVLANRLKRSVQTLRKWEKDGILPPTFRDSVGRRVYTTAQIDGVSDIVNSAGLRPGYPMPERLPRDLKALFDRIKEEM